MTFGLLPIVGVSIPSPPFPLTTTNNRSRNSVVGIVTSLRPGRSGVKIPGRKMRLFSSPKHGDRLWGPPSL
jgi:hypothetical protein